MSLRGRLTLAFLVLAVLPSFVVSVVVLRQLVSTTEWWDNAGVEEALTSSVAVAKTSLLRLESGLRLSAAPLFELARQRRLDLGPGAGDRVFLTRFLRDTGLDLFQIYRWSPRDSLWRLEEDVPPAGVLRPRPPDLSPELNEGRLGTDRPAQSRTGVFALLENLPPDTTSGERRLAAAGYALPEDFFLRLSELQLGLGTFRALSVYSQVFRSYFRLVVAGMLVVVAILAVLAGALLARHLTDPILELAESFSRVDGGTAVQVVPRGAPEVRRLAEAFNAMTARLAQARYDLARAERAAAWQGVARQVAHEIKNPLTTLSLALYNMEREFDRLPPDARAHAVTGLESLRRELDALADLAESFAALGAMPEIHRAPVDLNALVEGFVASSPWPHVTIEKRLDSRRPIARGDERQLRRVLRNLVKNGCEAQPAGGRIVLSTAVRDEERVAFEVQDEGPGMDADTLARVFDPDFSTKGRGSGVGLAVTRRIVEQHGGELELDSEPGRGTRARVVLPAHVAAAATEAAS